MQRFSYSQFLQIFTNAVSSQLNVRNYVRRVRPRLRVFPACIAALLVVIALPLVAGCDVGSVVAPAPPLHAVKVSKHYPFLVILCAPSDNPQTPARYSVERYQEEFLTTDRRERNVWNYFVDQSYGIADLAGTTVIGPFVDNNLTTAAAQKLRRQELAQDCADTAQLQAGSSIHWSDFTGGGVITIWNATDLDSGYVKGAYVREPFISFAPSQLKLVNGCQTLSSVSFFTHEMLHTFGLDHAHGPYPHDLRASYIGEALDLGETHTFGNPTTNEYGDCWSIMGCGYWVGHDVLYGDTGPDLSATQRHFLGWWPEPDQGQPDRMYTYRRVDTVTRTLAPANEPWQKGDLLIDIPLSGGDQYTVEYLARSGWSDSIPVDHALLIREVRVGHESETVLVGRTPYGAWLTGQIFYDPANHVHISIDFTGASASVTLAPDGPRDGGAYSCYPPGNTETGDLDIDPGYVLYGLPTNAHFTAGSQVTWHVDPLDPVFPSADVAVTWSVDGVQVSTERTTKYTFPDPGPHKVKLQLTSRDCFTNILIRDVTVDSVSG